MSVASDAQAAAVAAAVTVMGNAGVKIQALKAELAAAPQDDSAQLQGLTTTLNNSSTELAGVISAS